jgi:adenylylsulfate kinase-like enzyme
MVYWITGRKNSGKTTLAYRLKAQIPNSEVIDADEIRKRDYPDLGYTDIERRWNIMNLARLARQAEKDGKVAIVAAVSPKRQWREEAQSILDECIEICMPFGELWEGTDYEEPEYENV